MTTIEREDVVVEEAGLQFHLMRSASGEPLVRDLELARWLGFDRDRNIRKLIDRWEPELGEVCSTVEQTSTSSTQGGRPGREYLLTEHQALFIAAKSETPRATEVLKRIITVFMAVRRGRLKEPSFAPSEPTLTWASELLGAEAYVIGRTHAGEMVLGMRSKSQPACDAETVRALVREELIRLQPSVARPSTPPSPERLRAQCFLLELLESATTELNRAVTALELQQMARADQLEELRESVSVLNDGEVSKGLTVSLGLALLRLSRTKIPGRRVYSGRRCAAGMRWAVERLA